MLSEDKKCSLDVTRADLKEGRAIIAPPKTGLESESASIPDPEVNAKSPARRQFNTQYKLDILAAYESCDNALSRGALLRREGLYASRISAWRQARDSGRLSGTRKKKDTHKKRDEKLAHENRQLKQQLTQAQAIIDLQKKISELLGAIIPPPERSEKY